MSPVFYSHSPVLPEGNRGVWEMGIISTEAAGFGAGGEWERKKEESRKKKEKETEGRRETERHLEREK